MARSFKLVSQEQEGELRSLGFSLVTESELQEGEERTKRHLSKRQRRERRERRQLAEMRNYFAHAAADMGDDSIDIDD